MPFVPWTWNVDATRVLTRRELATVLVSLRREARRRESALMNLAIVRLACCCGLRASEIAGLTKDDVVLVPGRPHLRIRPTFAKGARGRRVPLWWDVGTLADLGAWKAARVAHGAREHVIAVGSEKFPLYGQHLLGRRDGLVELPLTLQLCGLGAELVPLSQLGVLLSRELLGGLARGRWGDLLRHGALEQASSQEQAPDVA